MQNDFSRPPRDSYNGGHTPYNARRDNGGYRPSNPRIQDMKPGDVIVSARKTFFRTPDDFKQAYAILLSVLNKVEIGRARFQADSLGQYPVDQIIQVLKEEDAGLSYIGRDHITELFFKDPLHKLILNGNLVSSLGGGMAIPPDTLYYASTARIAARILSKGLMSSSRPYLPLSSTADDACRKCSWFVSNSGEDMVVLSIDAKAAYDDGVLFSYSGRAGEFLVERVSSRYITEHENRGPVLEGAGNVLADHEED